MNTTKVRLSFLFAIFLSLSIFFGATLIVAGTGDNVVGYGWSSNTGWMKLNNCDANGACTGSDFGVSALPAAPGTLSGYAWSSNLGWITFSDPSCPVSGCTAGAHVDWGHPNSDGSFNIKGWARVCSVYQNNCSGTLDAAGTGGWDGYIALGNPAAATNAAWGLTVAPDYSINGYAWGSDVVGWVQFVGAKIVVANPVITDFSSDVACVPTTATKPNFSWDSTGTTGCTINVPGGTAQTVDVSSQAAGGTLSSDGKYYKQSPFAISGTGTTFTLACGTATQSLTVAVCPDPTPTDHTCPEGQIWSNDANACIPVPSCPTGQVWNASANACQPAYNNACPIGQSQDADGNCVATVCPANTVLNAKTGACDKKKKPIFNEY